VIIPDPVFDQSVKRNAGVLDAIKYTQRGIVTAELLKEYFGVKEVIIAQTMAVGMVVENAGTDILTGYAATNLWGDDVWVGLIAEGENQMVPTFARTFNQTSETAGQARQVREYRAADEGQEGNWIEVKECVGEQLVFKDGGVLIKNTSSTF
jgi:hypothetical protein